MGDIHHTQNANNILTYIKEEVINQNSLHAAE